MSDSVRPHRGQPTRLRHPWDSPGKNTGVGCHFLLQCMKVKSESEVTQSCPTLSDPMDCSPPVSSAHGIFQARVLEWVAIAFSGSDTGDFQISWPMSTFQKIVPINTLFMHFCLFHINIFCLTLYQRQKIKSQTNAPKVYVPSCVLTYKHMCTHTPQNLACERYWVKWSKSKGLNPQFNYFFSWHMWK